METGILLLVLLIAADIALWGAALVAPLSSTGRFRVFAAAIFLLLIIGGNLIGWGRTMALASLLCWLAAIVGGRLPARLQGA